ncbi:T-complex 11 [Phaffia rhodozyma]|uniref:T-complex 11 n=1 Tax=Phaffia rhodozyma TaxID=264483 RepID=A0A0F7SEX9_PHARH|nr:T-complex 11 [Phaffia rhodozyma]
MVNLTSQTWLALQTLASNLPPSALSTELSSALTVLQSAALDSPSPTTEWVDLQNTLIKVRASLQEQDKPKLDQILSDAREEMKGLVEQDQVKTQVEIVIKDPEDQKAMDIADGQNNTDREAFSTTELTPMSGIEKPLIQDQGSLPSNSLLNTSLQTSASTPTIEKEASEIVPPALLPLILESLARSPAPSSQLSSPVATLHRVSLLSTLALAPETVLPPGKNLTSLLSQPNEAKEKKRKRLSASLADGTSGPVTMEERVTAMMKKAFWDDAANKLHSSGPSPAIRLSLLQSDLTNTLSGLLPPHMIKDLFPVPEPGVAWDRAVFSQALVTLLNQLAQRCAPARDDEIQKLRSLLASATDSKPSSFDKDATKTVLAVMQGVLDLAELMKSDLTSFQLLAVPPSAIPSLIRAAAQTNERTEIISLLPLDQIRSTFSTWTGPNTWTKTLLKVITSSEPIALPALPLPPAISSSSAQSSNGLSSSEPRVAPAPAHQLPVIFVGVSQTLFRLQNQIQALVITACLMALLPASNKQPPAPSGSASASETPSPSPARSISAKTFDLLLSDLVTPSSAAHTSLSDIHALLLSSYPTPPDELTSKNLRSAIDRVLRTEDPVWGLLLSRLTLAVELCLEPPLAVGGSSTGLVSIMRTGREVVQPSGENHVRSEEKERIEVKGFEGEALERGIKDLVGSLERVKGWVEQVWTDVVLVSK